MKLRKKQKIKKKIFELIRNQLSKKTKIDDKKKINNQKSQNIKKLKTQKIKKK